MKTKVLKQIQRITNKLLEKGLLSHNKNSIIRGNTTILWNDYDTISDIFDFDKYSDLYKDQVSKENYNFRIADGSIIQMMYRFSNSRNSELLEHRLTYLPNPKSSGFSKYIGGNNQGDGKFGDLLYDDDIVIPVRIDYCNDSGKYKEFKHPYCHLTLGGHKDCRIAVKGPITPFIFMEFILRSFYQLAYDNVDINFLEDANLFSKTISTDEAELIHFSFK